MMRAQFVRHVATLLSGKAIAQVLSLAMVPIIARLFDPRDFGVVAIFSVVTQGLALIAPLRFFRASLLTEDDERARMLLAMSVKALLIACVLVLVVVAIAGPGGFSVGFLAPLGIWVWLIPVGMFLFGMDEIMATVNSRHKTFHRVAMADVGEALLMGATRILAGLGGSSVWGLIAGIIVSGSGRLVILARGALGPFALLRTRMEWRQVKELAVEYRDFPLNDVPAGLVTFLAGRVPILMMGVMFAPAVVGYYAMADRLIRLPVVNAGIPIREVFMRKLVANSNSGFGLRRPLTLLTLGMLALGIVPFGLLGFFGSEILTVLLGERWADAGVYTQILAPWYYAAWVSTGVQPTLVTLRRQGLWLRIQFGTLLGRLTVFGIGYLTAADVETTLKWFSGLNVLSALLVLALVFHILTTQGGAAARPNGGPTAVG